MADISIPGPFEKEASRAHGGDQHGAGELAAGVPRFVASATSKLLKGAVISAVVVIPCLWQSRIEAGDLRSHVYNAWLAQLIEHGRAPGLWIVRQWNNVLFDLLLSGLGRIFPLQVAGRVAAVTAVLIFFWGTFAFISAVTKRLPWFLVPLIAMLSFGWTYEEGVFNYYLSIGLAFIALAIHISATGWKRCAALFLVPLVVMAHLVGFAWMIGAIVYIQLAKAVAPRLRAVLVVSAVFTLGLLHVYIWHRFRVEGPPHSILFYSGLDQIIFTRRYEVLAVALGAIMAVAMAAEVVRGCGFWKLAERCAIPIQLYLIVEAGIQLLPDTIYLPQYAAPLSDLSARLTLLSAVILCCILGALGPRKWHLVVFTGIAVFFFAFIYQDTARLVGMEAQVDKLLRPLPAGQRILATIHPPLKYRFSAGHIIEPSCIGRCFSYGNYEPPTGQFRIRAAAGNGVVVSDIHDASLIEQGNYVVRPQDLPAYQVYQCGQVWTNLCIRPLLAGEMNDPLRADTQ